MAKQYIIYWDYCDKKNVVHPNNKISFIDKEEANKTWLEMKSNGSYFNMRAETKEPTRRVVQIEFIKGTNPYTYETTLAVKKGSWLVVEVNGQKKVVQAISDDHDEPEEELAKRFDISKIKKIFGVVKTK